MDPIYLGGAVIEIACALFILWMLPQKNRALLQETMACFPENLRRRLAWRKRKILRAAGRLYTLCLQCHAVFGK